MNETTDEHRAAKPQPKNISPRLCGEIRFGCGYAAPGSSVLLTRKSFAGRKGFFFAKKTRRTLVWLRLCCSVFIGGFVLCNLLRDSYRLIIHGRDARATMASWHGRPGHDTKLDRLVNFVSTK